MDVHVVYCQCLFALSDYYGGEGLGREKTYMYFNWGGGGGGYLPWGDTGQVMIQLLVE